MELCTCPTSKIVAGDLCASTTLEFVTPKKGDAKLCVSLVLRKDDPGGRFGIDDLLEDEWSG
jgi:hypothetical protein